MLPGPLRRAIDSLQRVLRLRWVRLAAQIVIIVGSLAYLASKVGGVGDFVRGRQISYVWLAWAVE